MIVYLKNSEIDREQWDNCINASQSCKSYAYSWYLDIMAPGWEALIDDDYDSVFPLPGFSKFGIQYITTPVFLQQLGAFSPDKPESKVINEFIDYMPEFYKFIDLCIGQKIEHKRFKVTERANYELDLSYSYSKLWTGFSSHCRRNIQTAVKRKIELTSEIAPEELTNTFVRNKGLELKGIKQRDYNNIISLMKYCTGNNKGRIIGVRSKGHRLICGLFLVEIPGRITTLFVVNSPESREDRVGYYLLNELIRDKAQTGVKLDFAGSSIPSVASYNESFGSNRIPYYRIYRNQLPWPIRMFK
jgi:hypothetical protein